MPTRFSTEAANADVMGEDVPGSGAPEKMPHAIGADGTPRDRSDAPPQRVSSGSAKAGESRDGEPKERDAEEGQARPGKDINAAGFVKDKDATKP